jgi:hypothetical protein
LFRAFLETIKKAFQEEGSEVWKQKHHKNSLDPTLFFFLLFCLLIDIRRVDWETQGLWLRFLGVSKVILNFFLKVETYSLSALAISNKSIQFLKKNEHRCKMLSTFFPILHFGDNLRSSKNSHRQKIGFKY